MTLKLERCQQGAELPTSANSCSGEAGYGVYAYVPSSGMRAYYSANGESIFSLVHRCGEIVHFRGARRHALVSFIRTEVQKLGRAMVGYKVPVVSGNNVQRFGSLIEFYISERYPNAVAYLVPHQGPGIPTGTQAVIRDLSAFDCQLVK
ncbi:MAG: hypothetical protein Q7S87_03195 [Agitococcus sp.]|nr:hypothetical protein [Agitococcus sp.]MDO9178642.1 hypothetical protein [Agitococcus sp.]